MTGGRGHPVPSPAVGQRDQHSAWGVSGPVPVGGSFHASFLPCPFPAVFFLVRQGLSPLPCPAPRSHALGWDRWDKPDTES